MSNKSPLDNTARLVDLQESATCAANDQLATVRPQDACCSEEEPAERDFPSIGAQVINADKD